jgi:hypothetical protein
MFEENEIVTVLTTNAEYVGRFATSENGHITLKDPRFVSVTEQGLGFANTIALTSEINPKSVTLMNVSFVTKTNDDVAAAYRQHTSGIVLPQSSLIT